jgi:hypothetical protein
MAPNSVGVSLDTSTHQLPAFNPASSHRSGNRLRFMSGKQGLQTITFHLHKSCNLEACVKAVANVRQFRDRLFVLIILYRSGGSRHRSVALPAHPVRCG